MIVEGLVIVGRRQTNDECLPAAAQYGKGGGLSAWSLRA